MSDRASPLQANYPVPEDFVAIARRLRPDAIDVMLGFVWKGYDRLREKDEFTVREDDAHLEDEITEALCARIQDVIHTEGFSPFAVVHQWLEREQQKDKGRQPQCDLGFRLLGGNVRSHFTIEAKVIPTESAVAPYVGEITDNLLTGRYSAFSSEAAMLGYLLSGKPQATFAAISRSLGCVLRTPASFAHRDHRVSDHKRESRGSARVPAASTAFRCHHLLLTFRKRIAQDQ